MQTQLILCITAFFLQWPENTKYNLLTAINSKKLQLQNELYKTLQAKLLLSSSIGLLVLNTDQFPDAN